MKKNDTGFIIEGKGAYLHIIFYGENIVRFAYSKDKNVPSSTVAVVGKPVEAGESFKSNRLLAGNFQIEVEREKLTVKVFDRSGRLLNEDLKVNAKKPGVEKKRLSETGFYGNGEKYTWLNQLGYSTVNYNSDVLHHNPIHHPQVQEMHTAIPFYIGASPDFAYGIYFDNSYRTEFDFAKSDSNVISFQAAGGYLDYYFMHGSTVADVVSAYGLLTGTPPLPRKKYLGFHQSRYSYQSGEELLTVADQLRRHDIPCDVLYLDIDYTEAYKVFTVDNERFKGFKKMIGNLKEMGFAVVVIINPGVKVEEGYRVYEEGKENNYFVTTPSGEIYQGEVWPKPAAFPDFLRSEVRHWWGELHRELLACGVDGIWNDMNEPANFTEKSGTLPDEAVHLGDNGIVFSHAEAHNIYGLMQARATREALEQLQPEKRPFVLTRAAFAGSQRYAALWTGDNSSVWEHLECSIPMILNLGLSGYSFVGADVGGYRGDCSGELLVRWTQLGAFIPYFRNHSEIGTARQEPWEFSNEVLDIVRKYIRLRYNFLTYIYNLMRESTLTGAPAVRPLLYHYDDEPDAYHISDQFLLGEGLMVCPVTRPGITHRQVYLPRGQWFDYWTGENLNGNRYLTVESPLGKLPLFIRAGTILPIDDHIYSDHNRGAQTALTMHCYAGKDGLYRLYLDDGTSFNYRQEQYSELEIILKDDPVQPAVKTNIIKDNFPIPEIKYIIHHRPGQ